MKDKNSSIQKLFFIVFYERDLPATVLNVAWFLHLKLVIDGKQRKALMLSVMILPIDFEALLHLYKMSLLSRKVKNKLKILRSAVNKCLQDKMFSMCRSAQTLSRALFNCTTAGCNRALYLVQSKKDVNTGDLAAAKRLRVTEGKKYLVRRRAFAVGTCLRRLRSQKPINRAWWGYLASVVLNCKMHDRNYFQWLALKSPEAMESSRSVPSAKGTPRSCYCGYSIICHQCSEPCAIVTTLAESDRVWQGWDSCSESAIKAHFYRDTPKPFTAIFSNRIARA